MQRISNGVCRSNCATVQAWSIDSEMAMTEAETTDLLKRYSEARMSAVELRRALGGATYGEILVELARRDLPLPRAPEAGRQQRIAAARSLLFPGST